MKRIIYLLILSFCPLLVQTQTPYAEILYQELFDEYPPNDRFCIYGDFDSDGIKEMAINNGQAGKQVLKFIKPDGETYKEYAYLDPKNKGLRDIDYDSKNNKIYFLESLVIYSYCPMSNTKSAVFTDITEYSRKIKLIESTDQILLQTKNNLYLMNLDGEVIQHAQISNIIDFSFANVDDDENLELLISFSNSSKILNLQTFEEKWSLDYSLGNAITTVDVNKDGIDEILSKTGKLLGCHSILNQSILWSYEFPDNIITQISSKGNDQDKDIILISTTKDIYSISPIDGEVLWKKNTSGSVNFQLIDDLNADGNNDVCYFSVSEFEIMDLNTLKTWTKKFKFGGAHLEILKKNENDKNANYSVTSGKTSKIHQIYKAQNDSTIGKPKFLDLNHGIKEKTTIRHNDHTYIFFKNDFFKSYIFRNNLITPYLIYKDNVELRNIEFIPPTTNSITPLFMGLSEDNKLMMYSFTQDEVTLEWESPSSTQKGKLYKTINIDEDVSKEAVILYDNVILIYDLDSKLLEKQIPVEYHEEHNVLEVVDFNKDGYLDIIIGGKSEDSQTDIQIIDLKNDTTEDIILLNDNHYPLRNVRFLNIDQTEKSEIVFVGNKLYIYDLNTKSIKAEINPFFASPKGKSIDLYDFYILDIDNDNHMDILMSYEHGFARIRINQEAKDTELPQIKIVYPTESQVELPTNNYITIEFSEPLKESTLSNILVLEADEKNIEYTSTIKEGKYVQIAPNNTWPSNAKIAVIIPNTVTDVEGNPMDGNKNGIPDGENDLTKIIFNIGNQNDTEKPYFNNLEAKTLLHPSERFKLNGIASDIHNKISSNIHKIVFSINEKANIKENGVYISSTDKELDSQIEAFNIELNTDSLPIGDHTIYLATSDECQNWSEIDSINFKIIPEANENWPMFSKNYLNTSYAPSSTFNYPVKTKYSIEKENGKLLNAAIVVDDKLIYTSKNQLWVREMDSGKIIWKKEYSNSFALSTPSYKYGNLYIQVGNHMNSSIQCLSLSDGSLIWSTKYSVQWKKMTSPIVSDGKVIIIEGIYNTTMSSYDAYNGELLWFRYIGNPSSDPWNPAVYNGKLYGLGTEICIIDIESGDDVKRIFQDEFPIYFSSNVSNPILDTLNNQIILTNNDYVFALDLENYSLKWKVTIETFGFFRSSHALVGNSLYIGASNQIMKVSANTGEIIWKNEDYSGNFQPVASDSIVAFSSDDQTIFMDIAADTLKGKFNAGGHLTLYKDYLILTEKSGKKVHVLTSIETEIPLETNLVVLDSIGCHGEHSGTIKVIVNENDQGNYSYLWADSEETTNTRTNLPAGKYFVTVTNEYLETAIDSITLTEPDELTLETFNTNDINGQNNGTAKVIPSGGTPPYTYNWKDFPGLSIPNFENLKAGNYIVEVIDSKGCSKVTTIIVYAITGTNETLFKKAKLYPTVSDGKFHLECSCVGAHYTLHNGSGKTVKKGIIFEEKTSFNENLPSGIYYLHLKNDQEEWTIQFFISR